MTELTGCRAQFTPIAAKGVADNRKLSKTKLLMPVLAIGGENYFGSNLVVVMRNAATNVQEIVLPAAGHWLMEAGPQRTVPMISKFLGMTPKKCAGRGRRRSRKGQER